MSEKQKTYHLMILDRSSSMNSVRDTTISGLNEQLSSIKQAEEDFDDQEQVVCFVTFSDNVEMEQIWDAKISDVENFNQHNHQRRTSMTDEKPKKSCLPSILMLIGFFLFILAAIAIPSMDKNSRYIGGIFAVISLCISLTGFLLAFIVPFLRKRKILK